MWGTWWGDNARRVSCDAHAHRHATPTPTATPHPADRDANSRAHADSDANSDAITLRSAPTEFCPTHIPRSLTRLLASGRPRTVHDRCGPGPSAHGSLDRSGRWRDHRSRDQARHLVSDDSSDRRFRQPGAQEILADRVESHRRILCADAALPEPSSGVRRQRSVSADR